MSLFKYSFFFKINYATTFGYNLCIVGNIKQLGSWNPMAAMRLDWNEVINNIIFLRFLQKKWLFKVPQLDFEARDSS